MPGKSCPFLSLLGDLEAVGISVVELMSRCTGEVFRSSIGVLFCCLTEIPQVLLSFRASSLLRFSGFFEISSASLIFLFQKLSSLWSVFVDVQ